MSGKLIARLWNDEAGAVIAAEYLLLGSVVAVGSVSGLTAVRDSMVDEYKEYGQSIRDVRRGASQTSAPKPAAPITPAVQAVPGYTLGQP